MKTIEGDVLVVGATAAGVAAAVTCARLGLRTVMTTYRAPPGGVLPSLGAIETHYPGVRSPFVEDFKARVLDHYRTTYGADSEQYQTCVSLDPNIPMITFEPHVAEHVIAQMIDAESLLTTLPRLYPVSVELNGRILLAVTLRPFDGGDDVRVQAATFIDATYEGDLAAVAGVPYRIGREARAEYDEPHAGRLFTRWVSGKYPIDAAEGRLNLIPKSTTMGLLAGSTGAGDDNIQDYSYRICLSCDPANRRLPDMPPGYDRAYYLPIAQPPDVTANQPAPFHHRLITKTLHDMVAEDHIIHGHALPNNKRSWNATNLTGAGKRYPDADWPERDVIARRHLDHALGILFFLQNDEAVPDDIRAQAREWGLARDEFTDSDNRPPQLYVREARRIRGRYTLRESDCLLAEGLERAPIHADSIAITEFPLDSLPCTPERRPGTTPDGQFFLMEASRPGHISYRVLLPESLDNLLIPVTASVTHVAWGTVRQTPTLIQLCEAAAHAAALAHSTGAAPAEIDVEALQRHITAHGGMVTFFNDFDMATDADWVESVQLLGTRGFFASYDARPLDPLTDATAIVWAEGAARWLAGALDANALARSLPRDESGSAAVNGHTFRERLRDFLNRSGVGLDALESVFNSRAVPLDSPLTRGDACRFIDALTAAR